VFRTRIDDAIVQFLEVGGREFFTNAGRTAHDGIELGLAVEPVPGLLLSTAYTWGDYRFLRYRPRREAAVDTLDGNAVPGVPAHTFDFSVAVTRGPLRLEVEQSVRSAMWADDENTLEVPGWGLGVTALRVQTELGFGSALVRPFVALENVFDRPHIGAATVNGFGGRVLEPAPGRHLYVGVEARYRPRPGGVP
jgi:iron complex outermembrane receptor protein